MSPISPAKQKMDEYMNTITQKSASVYDKTKDPMWIKHKDAYNPADGPTETTYFTLLEHNYTLVQMKAFAKKYKLRATGSKKEIATRIFAYLYFSSFATKIQKRIRGYLTRLFNNELHGPACFKRSLCVNDTDFFTMDEIKSVSHLQFFSYTDVDNFIYGFDAMSLHNLIINNPSNALVKNPYNRNEIPKEVIDRFYKMIKIGKKLKTGMKVEIETSPAQTSEDVYRFQVLDLFQQINALGNYSDASWFESLDKYKLIRLVRELHDIWNYRLQLTHQMKCSICPPHGIPFNNIRMNDLRDEPNVIKSKMNVLNLLFKFVSTGIDRDSRSLGAYYVLGALTTVNPIAAEALPWLYQSMAYHH